MRLDLGDVVLGLYVKVKGHRRPSRWVWVIGAPRETEAGDRSVKGPPYASDTGKVDVHMDLQADKKVPLNGRFTDEVENPVEIPEGATVVYTVDDPTIINLTDNGDGTAVAAATGTLGIAHVEGVADFGDGTQVTGRLELVVVAGDAERFTIEAGEPEEVTPDDLEPEPTPV